MTDKFTIERIKTEMLKHRANFDDKYINDTPELDWLVEQVINGLQEPPFTPEVGQVLFQPYLEDDQPTGEYVAWGNNCNEFAEDMRELTLTEHGPKVKRLLEYAKKKRKVDPEARRLIKEWEE